jgi:type I restriction enzyme, S subunit
MNQDRTSTITNSQLKEGYKQTEVGIIPEDWTLESIQEFANIKTGPFGTLLKASEYAGYSGVPLISVGEIRNGFFRITEHTPFVPDVVVKRLPQYVLRRGDIVFGRKGAVERSALVEAEQEGWFLGSDGISIRPSIKCHAKYLAFQFQSHRVISWLIQNAIGTTMASLNQEILSKVVIPLPPTKVEQEAIACTLSDIDALIESLDRLLTKKRQIKQGAMQELLTGKRRLKGFGSKNLNYRQSSMGLIPDDWEQIEIGSFIDMLTGFPFPSSGYSSSGVRLLRGSNVKRGVTDWAEEETKYWASINHDIKQYLLKDKDIVIAMDGSLVGRSFAMLSESDLPAVLLQRVARIRSNVLDQKFLKEWICSQYFTEHCDAVKTVTAIPHISPDNIRSFSIIKPPTIEEQIEIANILSDMDAEIGSIESKLTKTRQLKQGMMHELLTGRIRLVES